MTTKDDETLEKQDQNTESNLEEDDANLDNLDDDSSDKDTSTDEQQPDKDVLDSLDDDQFSEWLTSGKLPEGVSTKKEVKKPEEGGEEGATSSADATTDDDDVSTKGDKSKSREELLAEKSKALQPGTKTQEKDPSQKDDKQTKPQTDKVKISQVDYKSQFEKIMAPFRANGKDITPRSVEDVISLMQQGANYTRKMQTLAPMRRIIESLEKAEIRSDDDINHLIDLHRGDKEAIKKLLQKHKVDPIDLDMDNTNYVPKNNMASDADVEYASVLEDIQPSIGKIQELISGGWDAKSKKQLLEDPKLLYALHEEIQMGRFDEVNTQLEIEKTFGKYKGMSDVEAYIDLVTKKVNQDQTKANTNQTFKPTNTPKKSVPDPNKGKAAPTGSKGTTTGKTTLTPSDLFNMSEEQFNKLSLADLI